MASDIVAIRSYKKGETIFREGEVGRSAFLVREGLVRIARARSSNNKQPVGRAGPGQVFGEHALFSIGPRPNSAIAEQPTKCVEIHRDKLMAKLKTEDAFIAALYNILATNMRSMMDQGADLDSLLQDLSAGTGPAEETAARKVSPAAAQPKRASAPKASPKKPPAAQKPPAGKKPPPQIDEEDEDDAFLI